MGSTNRTHVRRIASYWPPATFFASASHPMEENFSPVVVSVPALWASGRRHRPGGNNAGNCSSLLAAKNIFAMGDLDNKNQRYRLLDGVHDNVILAGVDAAKCWVCFRLHCTGTSWVLSQQVEPPANSLLDMAGEPSELLVGVWAQFDFVSH